MVAASTTFAGRSFHSPTIFTGKKFFWSSLARFFKKFLRVIWARKTSHLSASTLISLPARIMIRQCFLSFAISAVIWFRAISSFTRSCYLSFGLPRFRFPSTAICNIFLVASSFFPPLHMSKPSKPLLSAEFYIMCLFQDVYISHMI